MPKITAFILLLLSTSLLVAQDYELYFEHELQDDNLVLQLKGKSVAQNTVLGSSNLTFEIDALGIDQSQSVFSPNDDINNDQESYSGFGYVHNADYEHVFLLRNTVGNGSGQVLSPVGTTLGSLTYQVTDPCVPVNIKWIEKGAISNYNGDLIRSAGGFINSERIYLKDTLQYPELLFDGDQLVVGTEHEEVAYQWYLNDEIIEGANGSAYVPQENGFYRLAITNECFSKTSEEFEVGTITANPQEQNSLNLTLSAYPNPYADRTNINFKLPSSGNASLKLTNVAGTIQHSILDEALNKGNHELSLSVKDYGLPTGVYVLKLYHDTQVKNIKIIETE